MRPKKILSAFLALVMIAVMMPSTEVSAEGSISRVYNSLGDKYGVSSQKEFVSCLGANLQPYPSHIYGFLSATAVDLNGDGTDEYVAIRIVKNSSSDPQIVLEVLSNGVTILQSKSIGSIYYSSAVNVYLFYSKPLGKHCVLVDEGSMGSYTGINTQSASIFTVTNNSISVYKDLENVPTIGQFVDFDRELRSVGAPYAVNCTSIDERSSASYYQPLCEVIHTIYGDPAYYETRNHKQQIKDTTSTPGDATGDGKVKLADVSLILKHIAKWNVTVNTNAADVTGDGKVNLADVSLILKYIAKWNVTLK